MSKSFYINSREIYGNTITFRDRYNQNKIYCLPNNLSRSKLKIDSGNSMTQISGELFFKLSENDREGLIRRFGENTEIAILEISNYSDLVKIDDDLPFSGNSFHHQIIRGLPYPKLTFSIVLIGIENSSENLQYINSHWESNDLLRWQIETFYEAFEIETFYKYNINSKLVCEFLEENVEDYHIQATILDKIVKLVNQEFDNWSEIPYKYDYVKETKSYLIDQIYNKLKFNYKKFCFDNSICINILDQEPNFHIKENFLSGEISLTTITKFSETLKLNFVNKNV